MEAWEQLKQQFEGKKAIYIEKGVWLVIVSNIHAEPERGYITADIESSPAHGLGFSINQQSLNSQVSNWTCGGPGSFSDYAWYSGTPYANWRMFFHPDVIQKVVNQAFDLPLDMPLPERYKALQELVYETTPRQPTKPVFPRYI